MRKKAILRLVTAEILCFIVLLYNLILPLRSGVKPSQKREEFFPEFFSDQLEFEELKPLQKAEETIEKR